MNVRASITAEIDAKVPNVAGAWWSIRRVVVLAEKSVNSSAVSLTIPKGPKTAETITVKVELADLYAMCRELSREVPNP